MSYKWDRSLEHFSKSHSETEDFVNSAKQNPDVFLDHSTLLNIEQEDESNTGNVTLTFNVGKDHLEVKSTIYRKYLTHLCPLLTGARPHSSLAPILRVWPELVQRVPRGQPRPVRPPVWSANTRRCLHLTDPVTNTLTMSHCQSLNMYLSILWGACSKQEVQTWNLVIVMMSSNIK